MHGGGGVKGNFLCVGIFMVGAVFGISYSIILLYMFLNTIGII